MKTPKLTTRKNILALFMLIMACSKVQFAKQSPLCQGSGITCIRSNGVDTFDYTVPGSALPVDILFVVDNTASMSVVQQQIGTKFPSFFNTISNYDYHIGITTTDISSSTNPPSNINQSGALQDGKLIAFSSGESFLTNGSNNAHSLFNSAIQRPETASCEQWIRATCDPVNGCGDTPDYQTHCPSEFSRAITAAYMTVTQNPGGFLRQTAPLNVVVISNSDENITGGQLSQYPLGVLDYPSTLIGTVRSQFQNLKTLRVHSVIIQPGDTTCYNQQHINNNEFGWYGGVYQSLSASTGGAVGSICSSDFGQVLANIGQDVQGSMNTVTIYCIPKGNSVEVSYGNNPPQTISNVTSYTLQLPRAVQSNENLRLQYQCDSLQ